MSEHLTSVKGVYDKLGEIQLVDCREQYEWDAGHIDGAVYLPLNAIMAGAGTDLDKERPVAVICRTGNRSELATMMFQAAGSRPTTSRAAWRPGRPRACRSRPPTVSPAASPDRPAPPHRRHGPPRA